MQIKKIKFSDSGWSEPFPEWDSEQTLVIVFGSSQNVPEKNLTELTEKFPNSHIVGCSTAGEIFGTHVNDGTLSVAIAKFKETKIKTAMVKIDNAEQSTSKGNELADSLKENDLRSVFVLSDGLNVNGSSLVEGVNQKLGDKVIVTGGLAGDGAEFKQTWVLHKNKFEAGMIVAVGLYGEKVKIHHGSQGGWDIFGPERVVTKSKDNVVYEIDDQPALDLYKKYLGDKASELPASGLLFPLQVKAPGHDRPIVRTILAVNEEDKSMTFAGDVPENSQAQLMKANFDRLIDGATGAATSATDEGLECLVIAISCVGRRLILKDRVEEEVEATIERFKKGSEQVGFYSYGELSPIVKGAPCELHNQTMTVTAISEDVDDKKAA